MPLSAFVVFKAAVRRAAAALGPKWKVKALLAATGSVRRVRKMRLWPNVSLTSALSDFRLSLPVLLVASWP